MKLTTLFILIVCLQASATGFGQKVTITVKDLPLEKVFSMIKKQTGYVFFYDYSVFQDARKVTADVHEASIEDALRTCLSGQNLDFNIVEKTIYVTRKEEKKASAVAVADPPAKIDVRGRVVNEKGEPVPGATVKIKGEKTAMASTDEKGEFMLRGVEANALVIVSSVGYEGWELRLQGRAEVTVQLRTKVSSLDETQVIAYGTTTQRFSVGSVTTVKGEEITKQAISNPLQALEGRVPGLQVSQVSGLPGSSIQIRIRGQNSLTPTSSGGALFDNPLFIIDGVPFAPQNSNVNQYGSVFAVSSSSVLGSQGVSPFNSINPADIESIEVLRDADATAIYGSRGANGVILITTSKGKAGKVSFQAIVKTGESRVTRTMAMMNTADYVKMRREAFKNENVTPTAGNAPDLILFDTTRYTDYRKYFVGGSGHMTDAHASVSGGSGNSQFLVGATYHQEGNIYPGDFGDKRAAVDFNFHHNSTDKKFSLDLATNYSYDQNNSTGNTLYLRAFILPPNTPALANDDGSLNWSYKGYKLSSLTAGNPMAYTRQEYLIQNYNLTSNLSIGYQVLPGLTLRSSFGYNTFSGNEYAGMPMSSQDPSRSPVASANFGTNDFVSWIIEPQAEYKRDLGRGRFTFLVGGTFQKNTNNSTSIVATDYANDLLIHSIDAAGSTSSGGHNSLYKYNAVFGRVNYVYENRYIINLSGRRDGSSRFGPGRQFGNFGSIGAGWIFSEAALIKNALPFLSYGKLRSSYGTTGNDNIGDYQYLSAWAPDQGVPYQGSAGYIPQNLYNPDFSWGVTKKTEIGLELGMFKDRIITNATWYLNRSGNQLISYVLPIQTGFASVTQNAPYLVQNKGLELQITTTNIRKKNFKWQTLAMITIPRNKLASFPGLSTSPYAFKYVLGRPLSVLRKYVSTGVNDTTGLFQFKDADHNGAINQLDWQPIGDLDPKYFGSLGNTFTYKGFQLEIFAQFTKQLGANYFQQVYTFLTGSQVNLPATFNQRWENVGDKSDKERVSMKTSTAYLAGVKFAQSSGAYSDASFIRIKTIALSYDIPEQIVKKLKMSGCRFYANAQNLFTITGYKGNDPENQSYFALPPLKTVLFGMQLTF